ncbi:MAG: transglutaminase-like domain-containing protein [Anaerovoracaceae bacterium]|jgi:transglutaminase-like putative cysteine protease
MDILLQETTLLDYSDKTIASLISKRAWRNEGNFERLNRIYLFVRDEILFGYNKDDNITASAVLRDGYGQCNTKSTLFMALLRAVGIPCRIHGFMIDKELQKGAMTGIVYRNAPDRILHSWVEVCLDGTWYNLEGIILDKSYLDGLHRKFPDRNGRFSGYGVAVNDFDHPEIDFNRNNTYIQKEGITEDLGIFNSPDELFAQYHQDLTPVRSLLYQNLGRHLMNRNIRKIRNT